jgi:hypothetical protein
VIKPLACLQLIPRAYEEVVGPATHMHLQQHCYCRVVGAWKRADTPASRPASIERCKYILCDISVTLGKPRTNKTDSTSTRKGYLLLSAPSTIWACTGIRCLFFCLKCLLIVIQRFIHVLKGSERF